MTSSDAADPSAARSSSSEPEPTDGLKSFGEVLKSFRKRAGLTQEAFAARIGYSAHFVGSVEQGRRFPPRRLVDNSEAELDAFGTLRAAAKHLTRRKGLAAWFRVWAELELEAVSLSTYECRLIPGLLQTEAYARALFVNQLPPLDEEQIEAQLAARMERKRLLYERPNTAYSFILEEHLLLRGTGGEEVTRELIDHLIELAERRNIELQIMPVVRKAHAGMDGPMQLLETDENRWFAYAEGQRGGQFISDSTEVSVLQMRYARMRSQALSIDDSLSLLRQMRGA